MDVNRLVNWLLGGCGKEREKIELQSILFQLAEELHRGNATEDEVTNTVAELCEAIVVLAQQCGKTISQDQCVDMVTRAVKNTVPFGAMSMKLRSLIRSRRGSRATSSESSIL